MMNHKVSDMCNVIKVMYEKSLKLHELKYLTPKEKRDEDEIQFLIDDIQSMALLIGSDKKH